MNGVGVEFRGVRRWFSEGNPEKVRALDGVDLAIAPGEFVSVEGPSGCGKTTLLNLAGLLDAPTDGTVLWNGRDVSQLPERERTRARLEGVGFIFQRFYLLPTLTVRENVELPMRARRAPRDERQQRATALLGEVGLDGKAHRYPHELSGGEEQRVAIARSLANDPGLLLADEPTGELDSGTTARVLDLLQRVQAAHGATMVLVTHDAAVARRARRHLTMRDGRVVGDRREA